MSISDLINANITAIQSGQETITKLTNQEYCHAQAPLFSSSVGMHFRHILDHYLCFLSGLEHQYIDYDNRPRESKVEKNKHYAIAQSQIIENQFKALLATNNPNLPEKLLVTLQTSHRPQKNPIESTVERELVSLHVHTIHHFSLIAIILRLLKLPVHDSFGVAPSTLYLQQDS